MAADHADQNQGLGILQFFDLTKNKILESCLESNVSSLYPNMVKLLATNDMVVKKAVSHFVTAHSAENQELTLLSVNTLLKDSADANPLIRSLALKTLCELQTGSFSDYAVNCILKSINDPSAVVRRAAVTGSVHLHKISPEMIDENGIVDQLYYLIRDNDPIVVTNALQALDEILKDEGGLVINKNIAYYLLNKIQNFTDWGIVQVLNVLKHYKPKEEEVFDILNIIDIYLCHSNAAVVQSAIQLFLQYVDGKPTFVKTVFERSQKSLLTFITSEHPELAYLILELIESYLDNCKELYEMNFRNFFCKYNEPVYVKVKRVNLLPKLVNDENISPILEELSMYCLDVVSELSSAAIQSIGSISESSEDHQKNCFAKFIELLEFNAPHITSSVMNILWRFQLTEEMIKKLTPYLSSGYDVINDINAKCAILSIIGNYAALIEDSPYIIEDIIINFDNKESSAIKHSLLSTSVKLFFYSPAECQDMLGRILEICADDIDIDVQDRAKMYYHMLKFDLDITKTIIVGS